MDLRITEIFPNPTGADKGGEWVELCAGTRPVSLGGYALLVGMRRLSLWGSLASGECRIARTGSVTLRNREAEVSLLYNGALVQKVRTAGTAPEGYGYHVDEDPFWAPPTPGIASGTRPDVPPLPDLGAHSLLPSLLGTAACTAGILTALALFALRYARDRHHALTGGDPAAGS
jgi:hypothetical protein